MSFATINDRQGYVLSQLYERFGWSASAIATALGLKRRQVENAIRRAGVQIHRRSKKRFAKMPVLTPEAALEWFTHSALQEQPTLEPQCVNTGATYVYRRRRCQHCNRLNAYVSHCSGCGHILDWIKSTVNNTDVTELLHSEEYRHAATDEC